MINGVFDWILTVSFLTPIFTLLGLWLYGAFRWTPTNKQFKGRLEKGVHWALLLRPQGKGDLAKKPKMLLVVPLTTVMQLIPLLAAAAYIARSFGDTLKPLLLVESIPKDSDDWNFSLTKVGVVLVVAAVTTAIASEQAGYLIRYKDILRKLTDSTDADAYEKVADVFRVHLTGFLMFSFAVPLSLLALPTALLNQSAPWTLFLLTLSGLLFFFGWISLLVVAMISYNFSEPHT